jgi:hypothetical protein
MTSTTEVPEESLKDWYSLVPDPDNADADYWCIRLDKGEYTGLVYKYGEIGVSPKLNEDGTLPVNFEYDILFIPEELRKKEFEDEKKNEFENFIGSIMMQMVQEDLDIKSMGDDSSTDVDSEKKFAVKRRIDTTGSPFDK